jgi:hypothetical protein
VKTSSPASTDPRRKRAASEREELDREHDEKELIMVWKKLLGSAAVLATTAALVSMAVATQGVGDKQGKLCPQYDAEGMKRWISMTKPDFHHEKLGDFVGKWETETRMWMAGPDSEPSMTKGSAECAWLVEGKWLKIDSVGQMMGAPLIGHGLLGYDKYKSKYVGTWVDSLNTMLLTFEGNFDHTDKTLLLYGTMDEPASNEHDKPVKYIWRFVSKDKLVFEIHDLAIGEGNTRVIEITYLRKK